MKALIIGAGGIIGQHMMLAVPAGTTAVFTRRTAGPLYDALDLASADLEQRLAAYAADVIVNLAGENRPDVVERDPKRYRYEHVDAVVRLAAWCDANGARLIQVSSQAALDPVNAYGRHKVAAEQAIAAFEDWVIVRPTFVLGIRPFPEIGRENSAEVMLSCREMESVCDRWFSVSFAFDVAEIIWDLTTTSAGIGYEVRVGNPDRLTRLDVARLFGCDPSPISHDSLSGLAQRPVDTSYNGLHFTPLNKGIGEIIAALLDREADNLQHRAREISAFLRLPLAECSARLASGFGNLHHEVTADFHRANPQTPEELLAWYRATEAYIWELTAYHCDAGFNYRGMVDGIVTHLKNAGVRTVLCLGDGTGDLTLACAAAGLQPTYNDLAGSRIAQFARARFNMRLGDDYEQRIAFCESEGWAPPMTAKYDAIVSLDFLEHVPNVEEWVAAIQRSLNPGGLFCAQNAFAMGSGPDGSIPMHLSCNDRFEKDWDPTLSRLGFEQLSSNWYRQTEDVLAAH